MNIIGLSSYRPDSAVVLVSERQIRAAAQEERFSRKKFDDRFPQGSLKFCLAEVTQGIQGISTIAVAHDDSGRLTKDLSAFGWHGPVAVFEHNLCHAASAFLVSPYKEAAILVIDDGPNPVPTALYYGKGNEIIALDQNEMPHSIGHLYSAVTSYLGFPNYSEYRVMGLSGYGDMTTNNPVYQRLRTMVTMTEGGRYEFDPRYLKKRGLDIALTDSFSALSGVSERTPEKHCLHEHYDLAAAIQLLTEEILWHLLSALHKKTGSSNLCIAGSVALNAVANGKIMHNSPFRQIFIQPAAGDAGCALGAALLASHGGSNNVDRSFVQESFAYGPEFDDTSVRRFLDEKKADYKYALSDEDLVLKTAQILGQGKIVGWFQGRMEWGPRALGQRSILADPRRSRMRQYLNETVKRREVFRPFAPSVIAEEASRFFDCGEQPPVPMRHMLMVVPVRPEMRQLISAVTHVDGSARPQAVYESENPLFYQLIRKCGEITGVPMILNTSFNVRDEPIVCTPEDAYRCLIGTDIDCLVIGHALVHSLRIPT
jgi:carbamoyltransferase